MLRRGLGATDGHRIYVRNGWFSERVSSAYHSNAEGQTSGALVGETTEPLRHACRLPRYNSRALTRGAPS